MSRHDLLIFALGMLTTCVLCGIGFAVLCWTDRKKYQR